jgi:hypothetical protein
MTTLSKAEACALLHISDSTLTRRMRKGVYKFTRTGEGQYAEVQFTCEGLGLVEPSPEPTPAFAEAQRTPAVEAKPAPMPDIAEVGALPISEDSLGNPIGGASKYSLLGPQPPVEHRPKPGLFDHMDPALLGATEITTDGQPIFDGSSDTHPLNQRAIALGHLEPTKATKSRHPNQTRQEFLNLIFQDVRRGYSR